MSDQTKAADLAETFHHRASCLVGVGYCPKCGDDDEIREAADLLESQANRIRELEAALTLTPEKIEAAESAALRYDGELQNGPIVAALLAAGFQEPEEQS